jgi:hypothetical protein
MPLSSLLHDGTLEFHLHFVASNLVMGAMFTSNPIEKCDQPIAYASGLFNNVKKNYTVIEREALSMVYVLHKFKHYFCNSFVIFCSQ